MASAGEAVAVPAAVAAARPAAPADGEVVLWRGRPGGGPARSLELAAIGVGLGLLGWFAVELILPHFSGSDFAGNPDAGAAPLIVLMLVGMAAIIALPVWLRVSARGRARYMLTNRRALVWLGGRIVGEALLFGSEMRVLDDGLEFQGTLRWLDWRLKDEMADRLRFERIAGTRAGVEEIALIAEKQGARRAVESE